MLVSNIADSFETGGSTEESNFFILAFLVIKSELFDGCR